MTEPLKIWSEAEGRLLRLRLNRPKANLIDAAMIAALDAALARNSGNGQLGAVFLDGGFDAASEFILRQFHGAVGTLSVIPTLENPKGELQELLQSVSSQAPQYHVVAATGPDHDRLFECTVHHNGVELARGQGKSKKAAESEAALSALIKLRQERDALEPQTHE